MADLEDTGSKTKQLIQAYVDDHWAKTQSVCYFSSIGTYLNWGAPESRAVLSKGLGDFLRQNPVVHVVQFPGVPQKIGAIPLAVVLPEDISQLFSRSQPSSRSQSQHVYLHEFWNAFIRPIEGSRRYVLVHDSDGIAVHDGPIDHEGSEAYEIQPQDLTPSIPLASIVDKVKTTHSAIDAWLKKHSLDHSVFLRRTSRKHVLATGNQLAKFMAAFEGLSSDDLARIQIPLDILFKLTSNK